MTQWQVVAELAADGALRLARADGSAPWDGSPVDWLHAAVAGCFVKSCHVVLNARREAPVAVRAEVTGTKATDLPSRVSAVEIRWLMPDLDPDHAARIARDAKRVCTVTNSMIADFTVVPG